MNDTKESNKGSFWATLPGCVTAIAALTTAVVTGVVALYSAGIIGAHPTPTPPANTPLPPASSTSLPTNQPVTEINTPTLPPVIPTNTPMPPDPVGVWKITANSYPGKLNIIAIDNGKITGTIFDNYIEGTWDVAAQEITFKRNNSSDPNIFQIFKGTQIKQGDKYVLVGTFEDHDANGNVETYDWNAVR